MRIEKPRTPMQVLVKGSPFYRVGYAQMLMLRLIDALGRTEAPPKGLLTATGILREHIANDLFPVGYVDVERLSDGFTEYKLSKRGKEVAHGDRTIVSKPRTAKQRMEAREIDRAISLLERQRQRKARAMTGGTSSRRSIATG